MARKRRTRGARHRRRGDVAPPKGLKQSDKTTCLVRLDEASGRASADTTTTTVGSVSVPRSTSVVSPLLSSGGQSGVPSGKGDGRDRARRSSFPSVSSTDTGSRGISSCSGISGVSGCSDFFSDGSACSSISGSSWSCSWDPDSLSSSSSSSTTTTTSSSFCRSDSTTAFFRSSSPSSSSSLSLPSSLQGKSIEATRSDRPTNAGAAGTSTTCTDTNNGGHGSGGGDSNGGGDDDHKSATKEYSDSTYGEEEEEETTEQTASSKDCGLTVLSTASGTDTSMDATLTVISQSQRTGSTGSASAHTRAKPLVYPSLPSCRHHFERPPTAQSNVAYSARASAPHAAGTDHETTGRGPQERDRQQHQQRRNPGQLPLHRHSTIGSSGFASQKTSLSPLPCANAAAPVSARQAADNGHRKRKGACTSTRERAKIRDTSSVLAATTTPAAARAHAGAHENTVRGKSKGGAPLPSFPPQTVKENTKSTDSRSSSSSSSNNTTSNNMMSSSSEHSQSFPSDSSAALSSFDSGSYSSLSSFSHGFSSTHGSATTTTTTTAQSDKESTSDDGDNNDEAPAESANRGRRQYPSGGRRASAYNGKRQPARYGPAKTSHTVAVDYSGEVEFDKSDMAAAAARMADANGDLSSTATVVLSSSSSSYSSETDRESSARTHNHNRDTNNNNNNNNNNNGSSSSSSSNKHGSTACDKSTSSSTSSQCESSQESCCSGVTFRCDPPVLIHTTRRQRDACDVDGIAYCPDQEDGCVSGSSGGESNGLVRSRSQACKGIIETHSVTIAEPCVHFWSPDAPHSVFAKPARPHTGECGANLKRMAPVVVAPGIVDLPAGSGIDTFDALGATYTLLAGAIDTRCAYEAALVSLAPGVTQNALVSLGSDVTFFVQSGTGLITVNGRPYTVSPTAFVLVHAGSSFSVANVASTPGGPTPTVPLVYVQLFSRAAAGLGFYRDVSVYEASVGGLVNVDMRIVADIGRRYEIFFVSNTCNVADLFVPSGTIRFLPTPLCEPDDDDCSSSSSCSATGSSSCDGAEKATSIVGVGDDIHRDAEATENSDCLVLDAAYGLKKKHKKRTLSDCDSWGLRQAQLLVITLGEATLFPAPRSAATIKPCDTEAFIALAPLTPEATVRAAVIRNPNYGDADVLALPTINGETTLATLPTGSSYWVYFDEPANNLIIQCVSGNCVPSPPLLTPLV